MKTISQNWYTDSETSRIFQGSYDNFCPLDAMLRLLQVCLQPPRLHVHPLHFLRPPRVPTHLRGRGPGSRFRPLLDTGLTISSLALMRSAASLNVPFLYMQVNDLHTDPAILSIPGLADRGYIYIDGRWAFSVTVSLPEDNYWGRY
jgi:hypothetical protein